jgi:hypothetical protein
LGNISLSQHLMTYMVRVVYDARSRLYAKLSSILKEEELEWQPARSDDLVNIKIKLDMVKIGGGVKPIWLASKSKVYTSTDT